MGACDNALSLPLLPFFMSVHTQLPSRSRIKRVYDLDIEPTLIDPELLQLFDWLKLLDLFCLMLICLLKPERIIPAGSLIRSIQIIQARKPLKRGEIRMFSTVKVSGITKWGATDKRMVPRQRKGIAEFDAAASSLCRISSNVE